MERALPARCAPECAPAGDGRVRAHGSHCVRGRTRRGLICSCLEGYFSILLLSYYISSGALSCSMIAVSSHNPIILIITHLRFQPLNQ